jgi:O-antigen/teichoic acid export membrane protein
MQAQSFTKGVLSVGLWTLTKTAVSALTIPFLARILGTEGYGQYSYYLALLLLLAPLSNFGAAQSMNRNIPVHPDDRRWQRAVARIGAATAAIGALFGCCLLVVLVLPGLPQYPSALLFAAVLVGTFVFDLAHWYARGLLYGMRREDLAGIPASMGVVVGSVAGVALAWAGLGLFGAFLGLMLGNAGIALAVLWFSRRVLSEEGSVSERSSSSPEAGPIIRFGLSAMLFSTVNMVLYKSGVVLTLKILHDDRQTGLFAAALQMAEFIWIIPIAVEAVMLRTTTPLWVDGKREEITSLVNRITKYIALVTAGILLPVWMLADHAMGVYFGNRFTEAVPVLQILIPGVFGYSVSRMLWPVIQARGTMMSLLGVTATAAGANLLLCYFLIPWLGITGTAIAVSVSYGSVLIPYTMILRRNGIHPFAGFRVWRFLASIMISALAVVAVRLAIPAQLPALIVGTIVSFLAYGLAVVRLGLFTFEEGLEIVRSLPDALRKPAGVFLAAVQPMFRRIAP